MSHWDFDRLPADHDNAVIPPAVDDDDAWLYPITYERGRIESDAAASPFAAGPGVPDFTAGQPDDDQWVLAPSSEEPPGWADDRWMNGRWAGPDGPGDQPPGDEPWLSPPRRGRSRRGGEAGPDRRWLMAAGIVVAAAVIAGTAVLVVNGHPVSAAAAGTATAPAAPSASGHAASPPASPQATTSASSAAVAAGAPLSLAQAQAVLAAYTTANNSANAGRSTTQLATVEAASSYAIDAGAYRTQRATGAAPFPAYEPASATYYLPRSEPAAGPRWFVVRVGNAFASHPATVTTTEYLLFLQDEPGAPWRNVIEPYVLSGASIPAVAVGAGGLATAVSSTDATSLAVAPGQLPKVTATSFDGGGPVAAPGDLADRADEQFWQAKAPTVTIRDKHAPATAGLAFALLTNDGGALVFYAVAATLTITPPAGAVLHLTVPGLYSAAQSLHQARLEFRDQFAAYDPPAGGGTPRIVADFSGITGKA